MRRLLFAVAGIVALVATSVAVAEGIGGAKTAKSVAGTFSATSAKVSTRSCTTTDGKSLSITDARYTGTASGDPDLTGPITLRARSVINTTDGVGVVDGWLRIDVASGRDTTAGYSAVYDHGNIAGVAAGRAHEPSARLVANLSAGFSAAGGFTGGKLGGGTAGGSAVEIGAGRCAAVSQAEAREERGAWHDHSALDELDHRRRSHLRDSAGDSAAVSSKFKVNDRAEIHCGLVNGQNTLTRIAKR